MIICVIGQSIEGYVGLELGHMNNEGLAIAYSLHTEITTTYHWLVLGCNSH
jgi:hypothetical protein